MKRRSFLKTVGGAAGAAALGGHKVLAQTASPAKPPKQKVLAQPPGQTLKGQTITYQMGVVDVDSPLPTHFTKRTRKVGWWPDAADLSAPKERLFQEESFGIKNGGLLVPFGMEIKPNDEDSKKWVLGKKLAKPTDPTVDIYFTLFVRRLARRARQYNASLYRLRRLRFYSKYPSIVNNPGQVKWPNGTDQYGNNTWANKPGKPDPLGNPNAFHQMASDAESDWQKVTDHFHQYLSDIQQYRQSNLEPTDPKFPWFLLAFDAVTVNGYIMSMRVVVGIPDSYGYRPTEVGGSSSHVSLSSAFSSYSPP
jgi:hypothetical protein